ncbi:MAG TPA: hypothetical protein VK932_12790 [Kofleriaceae bacterium]|nr:hypothetical protein [Kofleriaceae bacterium]
MRARMELPAVCLGMTLAAINVVVIALGIAFWEPRPHAGIVMFVMMFGMVPGVALGAFLGFLAGTLNTHPVWFRRAVLVVPAFLLVAVLGAELSMTQLVPVSCIPTLAAALYLERATRLVPPVPVAHARRA